MKPRSRHLSPTCPLLAALILLAGFALRVLDLGDDSLWSDEAFTVFFASAPAGEFVELLLADGVHVPLYFALMRALPLHNDFLLRMPSVLVGVGGIAALMWVTRRLYRDPRLALWAGVLLAFNPFHVWFSRMARPYALFFMLALLVSGYFVLLLRGERSSVNWLVFSALTTAAYMTHFFAVALPLAQYAVFAFVLRGNQKMLRRWLLVQVIAFLPLAWWIYRLGTQDVVSFGIAWIPEPRAIDPLITLANLGMGFDGTLHWYLVPALVAFVVGLALGLQRAWTQRRSTRADLYWLWLILAAVPPVYLLSLVRPIYADRYLICCLPAVQLLTLRGWKQLANRWKFLPAFLLSAVLLTNFAQITLALHHDANERQAWDAAAAYIDAEWQDGDAFVMQSVLSLLPLERYWGDDERLARRIEPENALDNNLAIRAVRLWTVYPNPEVNVHKQNADPDFDPFIAAPDSPMGRWLASQRDHVITQRMFNGIAILLLSNPRF